MVQPIPTCFRSVLTRTERILFLSTWFSSQQGVLPLYCIYIPYNVIIIIYLLVTRPVAWPPKLQTWPESLGYRSSLRVGSGGQNVIRTWPKPDTTHHCSKCKMDGFGSPCSIFVWILSFLKFLYIIFNLYKICQFSWGVLVQTRTRTGPDLQNPVWCKLGPGPGPKSTKFVQTWPRTDHGRCTSHWPYIYL